MIHHNLDTPVSKVKMVALIQNKKSELELVQIQQAGHTVLEGIEDVRSEAGGAPIVRFFGAVSSAASLVSMLDSEVKKIGQGYIR